LIEYKFNGEIYPINKHATEILGLRVIPWALISISYLAVHHPEILELEINPLLVL